MRALGRTLAAALAVTPLFAQPAPPRFDLAAIHTSPPSAGPRISMAAARAGSYQLRGATMVDLIRTAYSVEPEDVAAGPSWLEWNRYDLAAKTSPAAPPESMKLMLQTLLAERFHLKVHIETHPAPAFVLSAGAGRNKLTEPESRGPGGGCYNRPQITQPGKVPYVMISCRNVTMEAFAPALRGLAAAYLPSLVVDHTGIKGTWDFDLAWTAPTQLARAGAEGVTVFEAVEQQLGLKLQTEDVPKSTVIVDSVDEKPTPDPPGSTALFTASAFESADIKPTVPGAQNGQGFQSPGRLDLRGIPLWSLITIGFDLPPVSELPGAPEWLTPTSPRFDISARTTTDAPDLAPLLQTLLADRFKLSTHYADRPATVYTLTAAEPKLRKADPATRTTCRQGPAPNAGNPNGPSPVLVTCRNITMAQFAESLRSIAPVYFSNTVFNATGLEGAWDFSFTFSPIPPQQNRSAAGITTIFDALAPLGLKLDLQSRPVPTLVIDHIEPLSQTGDGNQLPVFLGI